jgi:glycosyltransferase involved in cell wall biosynthesis
LFVLEDVPSPELRLLYKHARATICPSFGEGFDFSGVEAMRSGGAVVASDIAVHREIYGDAAEYFSPYSISAAARAVIAVIDPAGSARREELIQKGAVTSARYLPEQILPMWQEYLNEAGRRNGPAERK